jgi:hypothetical protein
MKLDFYCNWYKEEIERQFKLNEALNMPIGILSGLVITLFFMVCNFSFISSNTSVRYLFVFLLLTTSMVWIISSIYIALSYNRIFKSYKYKVLPYPEELNNQLKALTEYHTIHKDILPAETTVEHLSNEQMIDTYILCLSSNVKNNDMKSFYLHKGKEFMIFAFILTLLTSIPFLIQFNIQKEIKYFESGTKLENIENSINLLLQNSTTVNPINMNKNEIKEPIKVPPPPPPPPPRELTEDKNPEKKK